MDVPPTISDELLASLPPEVVAFIRWQGQQILALMARVAELEAKFAKNSKNSSTPPSTSHPHDKPRPDKKTKSPRKPGGQPGHAQHQRPLLPPERDR